MVAINSIPQQDVAKGNGQSELAQTHTYNVIQFVAKNLLQQPSGSTILYLNYSFFFCVFEIRI
jgi:hypothetical protein